MNKYEGQIGMTEVVNPGIEVSIEAWDEMRRTAELRASLMQPDDDMDATEQLTLLCDQIEGLRAEVANLQQSHDAILQLVQKFSDELGPTLAKFSNHPMVKMFGGKDKSGE